jgi:hypothetical protein
LVENFVDGVVDIAHDESGLAIFVVAKDLESGVATIVLFLRILADVEGECYVLAIATAFGDTAR